MTHVEWEACVDSEGVWFVCEVAGDDDGRVVCECDNDEDTAKRIVACVNACMSVPQEVLTAGRVVEVKVKQREPLPPAMPWDEMRTPTRRQP